MKAFVKALLRHGSDDDSLAQNIVAAVLATADHAQAGEVCFKRPYCTRILAETQCGIHAAP